MNPIQVNTANVIRIQRVPLRVAAAAIGLFTLAGCASAPQPPSQAMQAAELSIANAEKIPVADYASPELTEARLKLTAAREAIQQKKMVEAKRYAEQARVDADLATAKASAAKAKMVNDEILKGTATMKEEMQRKTGDTQ